MTKRVLYISPYFPPHRATGTKRAIAFTQGVHNQDGWEVIVLASKSFDNNDDNRMNEQIPDGVKISYGFVGILRPLIKFLSGGYKKKKSKPKAEIVTAPKELKPSKQKGLLTPFDQYVWDTGSAVRNGKKLIRKYKPDVIWVNADPWSGFLVADKLSRKFGIPWVGDMRDPWALFKKKFDLKPAPTAKTILRYERKFFNSASKIVLNTEAACEAHKEAYPYVADKFTFIRNAFNENQLQEESPISGNEVFTFGYYGGFRYFVPSNYILKGFATFIRKCNLKPSQVRFEVRGGVYSDFWMQLQELNLEDYVTVKREINADQGISLLRSWDVLLLGVLYDVRLMIPSKFYDYLYARKPIIAVSDNRELNRLIEETQSGSWASPNDTNKVAELFEKYFKLGKTNLLENESLIEPFGFRAQALRFRETLNEVISK